MVEWIDTHSHLNDTDAFSDLPAVLARAEAAHVSQVLVVGTEVESSQRATTLARTHERLYAVVGIQPNYVHQVQPSDFATITALLEDPKVVAVGESGLDLYWKVAPLELQREYFFKHLQLASDHDLPIVIHMRDCEAEMVAALREYQEAVGRPIRGVMHSFTGSAETAAACLELGLHISFAGMLTFKNNQQLRDVALTIPVDRLLVETDAPYLTPHPFRSQKRNEPAMVVHTGACLAGLFGMTVDELARITTSNARTLFQLPDASTIA